MLTHVSEEDKTTTLIQGIGSNYKSKAIAISEFGIYDLVFSSKMSQAKQLKHGVTIR
ncbi:Bro-N domain-containing protein [Enterococcus faecium]|nr:Bro-N domain-containing protein [Enterococcus faecium]MCZ1381597.1 Bro-N domain-containing protein [Enterococcus faecium]HAQ4790553.1 Bro-N domain-containing protein [Enterococcus faecium]HAQ5466284.1 Bro-N domain-containing protein [Enterococcus faecium]HAQ5568911.1 Bro-N domain-containing protein [Enterococcus faecium]